MLKIENGIGWKSDSERPGHVTSAGIPDYVSEIERLERDNGRLRHALKDTKHFFLGHFDDSCEECRRGLGVIENALKR